MVGFGALLPDIDNARSTLGHKLGWISKQIQHLAGHRTLFHSLLGLLLGSLIALGLEQLVSYLLIQQGFVIPGQFIRGSHLVFNAVLFGCIMHIAADALTLGGVLDPPLAALVRRRQHFDRGREPAVFGVPNLHRPERNPFDGDKPLLG